MSDKTQNEIISENLALYRKMNGLTQNELAEAIGYSNKSISKWERGEGLPDVVILIQLSEIYGITVSELIGQIPKCKETNDKLKAFERDKKALEKSKRKALEKAKKQKKKRKNSN
jgi:transcriptional regulator with XRE-family HTH domain